MGRRKVEQLLLIDRCASLLHSGVTIDYKTTFRKTERRNYNVSNLMSEVFETLYCRKYTYVKISNDIPQIFIELHCVSFDTSSYFLKMCCMPINVS